MLRKEGMMYSKWCLTGCLEWFWCWVVSLLASVRQTQQFIWWTSTTWALCLSTLFPKEASLSCWLLRWDNREEREKSCYQFNGTCTNQSASGHFPEMKCHFMKSSPWLSGEKKKGKIIENEKVLQEQKRKWDDMREVHLLENPHQNLTCSDDKKNKYRKAQKSSPERIKKISQTDREDFLSRGVFFNFSRWSCLGMFPAHLSWKRDTISRRIEFIAILTTDQILTREVNKNVVSRTTVILFRMIMMYPFDKTFIKRVVTEW